MSEAENPAAEPEAVPAPEPAAEPVASEAAVEAAAAHMDLRLTEVADFLRAEAARSGVDPRSLGKAFAKRLGELL